MRPKLLLLVGGGLAMWRLKRYYADATADDLWWMLAPTASLAGAATRTVFVRAAGEGYLSHDRLFLIEKSCAGINFMIAALGMLMFVSFHRAATWRSAGRVLTVSVLASYAAAIVVNATRISIAMWMAAHPIAPTVLTAEAAHRIEGITVYFCGLVLLYGLARRLDGADSGDRFWWAAAPLAAYYVVTLGIPMANGHGGSNAFAAHAAVVLVLPLVLIAVIALGGACARRRARESQASGAPARARRWAWHVRAGGQKLTV
ncbi:MAG TPA: exosortase K [Vicinamibacterales bacterium]|nr:exosortase K [Vicinamibacterales bacterium]